MSIGWQIFCLIVIVVALALAPLIASAQAAKRRRKREKEAESKAMAIDAEQELMELDTELDDLRRRMIARQAETRRTKPEPSWSPARQAPSKKRDEPDLIGYAPPSYDGFADYTPASITHSSPHDGGGHFGGGGASASYDSGPSSSDSGGGDGGGGGGGD